MGCSGDYDSTHSIWSVERSRHRSEARQNQRSCRSKSGIARTELNTSSKHPLDARYRPAHPKLVRGEHRSANRYTTGLARFQRQGSDQTPWLEKAQSDNATKPPRYSIEHAMDHSRRPVDSGSLQEDAQQCSSAAIKEIGERAAHAGVQAENFQGNEVDSHRRRASELKGVAASQDLQHGQSAPRLQACGCDRVGTEEWPPPGGIDSRRGESIPASNPGQPAAADTTATDSPYIRTRNLPGAQRTISLAASTDEVVKASIDEAKTRLRQLLITVHANKHELSDERKKAILASTCTVVESIRSQIEHRAFTRDKNQFLKPKGGST